MAMIASRVTPSAQVVPEICTRIVSPQVSHPLRNSSSASSFRSGVRREHVHVSMEVSARWMAGVQSSVFEAANCPRCTFPLVRLLLNFKRC